MVIRAGWVKTDPSRTEMVSMTTGVMYCFTSSCQKVGRLKLFMSGLQDKVRYEEETVYENL